MHTFTVRTTRRAELVDITGKVGEAVKKGGLADGIALVFCPHTTAGITINENADPSVCRDMISKTSELVEENDPSYTHAEGNSDSHVKSSLVGASETIIIEKGKLVLGTWQGIYFAEFDGPRTRSVMVKIIPGGS